MGRDCDIQCTGLDSSGGGSYRKNLVNSAEITVVFIAVRKAKADDMSVHKRGGTDSLPFREHSLKGMMAKLRTSTRCQ